MPETGHLSVEEFYALREGDRLEAKYADGWHLVVVVRPPVVGKNARVRRVGRCKGVPDDPEGRNYPRKLRQRRQLRRADGGHAHFPANVYADWLDDHDHPEAAKALRAAFPLDDGTGT
jgi:hypothetical protein